MKINNLVKRCLPPVTLDLLSYLKYGKLIDDEQLPNGTPLVGMVSRNEKDFYSACARQLEGAEGAIVDLGCWMGSTAVSLARGLSVAEDTVPAKGAMIYAFDRFIWESWMTNNYLEKVSCDYLPGDSFLPEARRRIQPYSRLIKLVKADLTTYVWQGGPIKLLLVDAMKSWELARRITSAFFPSLLERSILIHQDFKHYYTPWIHILQYRLRDHFRVVRNVPDTGTLAFETCECISSAAADRAINFDQMSDAEVEDAFQYSIGLVGEKEKEPVAAAHIMYFFHRGKKTKALEIFEQYCADGISVIQKDFRQAKQHLDKMKD